MMKYPRIFLFFLLVLIIVAVLIDLPKNLAVNIDTTIPIINKKIIIHRTFPGFQVNFFFAGTHIQKTFDFRKGLDLEGGTSISLKADMKEIEADKRKDALEAAKTVIEKRVNLFGVSEPVVQTSQVRDEYRIVVELPGVNVNEAMKLVGTTAQLSFWEEGASSSAKFASNSATPIGMMQIFTHPTKTTLTGSDLQNATVTFDSNTGKPQVQLVFTNDGAQKFADITKKNVGKIVAIALDNQVVEAPRVNEPILTGNAVISGGFTQEQAKELSIQFQAGALPIPLAVLEQHSIGATLGNISLQKSLFAGALGLLVIMIFMISLYGMLGVIASVALIIYTILVLAIFKMIPITLTLAGIAGFILSIGMAVDANILIFERMKEELRQKKKNSIAIEIGFLRAWTSIKDSNISTLITSFVLYQFGTGIIRGFAVTLAIGVLISMFSAILVTRTFLRIMYKN